MSLSPPHVGGLDGGRFIGVLGSYCHSSCHGSWIAAIALIRSSPDDDPKVFMAVGVEELLVREIQPKLSQCYCHPMRRRGPSPRFGYLLVVQESRTKLTTVVLLVVFGTGFLIGLQ